MLLLFTWKSTGLPRFSGSNINAVAPIGIYGGKDQFTSLSNVSAVAPMGFRASNSPGIFWNTDDSVSASSSLMGFGGNTMIGTFWGVNDASAAPLAFAGI